MKVPVELKARRAAIKAKRDRGRVQRMPLEWWHTVARTVSGACDRCGGFLRGIYVSYVGECAVVANCVNCGHDHIVLTGTSGAPHAA